MNPRKKPRFLRQNAIAYPRLGMKWRKPRGSQSKLRQREKSHGKMPSVGYGAPIEMKYLHPSGFKEILVKSLKDLEKIDVGKEAIKIGHTVGKRKRELIVKKAEELKLKILNK